MVGLGSQNTTSELFIVYEKSSLLRDWVRIYERWAGMFPFPHEHEAAENRFNHQRPILFPQPPLAPSLEDEPTMDDVPAVFRGMPNVGNRWYQTRFRSSYL